MEDNDVLEMFDDSVPSLDITSNHESFLDNPRYRICHLLHDSGIDHCIWAEDALAFQGIPTVVFDLYLLTEDIPATAQLLVQNGYTKKRPQNDYCPIPEFSERYDIGDPAGDNAIVLLSPGDWNYALTDNFLSRLPPFPKLLDSLMYRWTDECSMDLRMHLGVLISYCYLYKEGVKTFEYAAELSMENRQLHFDLLDGPASGEIVTQKCQEHYRMVREQIRNGGLVPTGQSNVRLFETGFFKH